MKHNFMIRPKHDIKAGRHYMHPSGVRIGVPETTHLGMKEGEMKEIAGFIKRVVVDKKDPQGAGSEVCVPLKVCHNHV